MNEWQDITNLIFSWFLPRSQFLWNLKLEKHSFFDLNFPRLAKLSSSTRSQVGEVQLVSDNLDLMTAQLGDLKGVIRAKEGLINDLTKAGKESEEVRRRLERKLGEFERELRRTQRDLFSAQSILRRVEKTSTADSDSTSLHLDYKKNVDKYKKQVCFHNMEVNVIFNL